MNVDLTVTERLSKLLRPLKDDEFIKLESNILDDKQVLDPIVYWNDGSKNLVIDGMHRLKIAKKHGIPYHTKRMTFKSIEEAEVWMLDHADGRRHIQDKAELRKLRGELYNRLKRPDGGHGKQQASGVTNGTPPPKKAAEVVAEKHGGSARTVIRDGKYVESLQKLSEPVRKAVEDDRLKVTDQQLHALAKAEPTKQQEVARAVRTGAAKSTKEALEKVGISVPKKKQGCDHRWVSDGNGERYCESCKEDHPDNGKNKVKPGKEKVSAAKLVDGLTRQHIGYLVRGIDEIARANGGMGPIHTEANTALNTLITCLKKMRAGER